VLCIQKLDALFSGVTKSEIMQLSPVHRQRLAQVLRHIADLCDPPASEGGPVHQEAQSERAIFARSVAKGPT
jgi:hypothetical protein